MASSDSRSGISTGLPDLPSGLPDKEYRLVAPLYLALKELAAQVSQATGLSSYPAAAYPSLSARDTLISGRETKLYVKATEALAYGDPVNFHLSGTDLCARKASAANNTKPCQALCVQVGGLAVNAYGAMQLGPALIPAAAVGVAQIYLSTTGGLTTARPAAAGNIIQALGWSMDAQGMWFNPSSLFIQL